MCIGVLPTCMSMCPVCACAQGGQNNVSDPLALESQMVVSLRVGAGNQTEILWKSRQWLLLITEQSLQLWYLKYRVYIVYKFIVVIYLLYLS